MITFYKDYITNHGYEPRSKLWKLIPKLAAGYYPLHYAGLFDLQISETQLSEI
jgi:hypothetical protein